MTVVAGLIAARFGPVVGGLFLAFPAIFPASATLIEKHVRERKEKAGLPGARRGKEAAALDAAGAALGSFGLAAFGLVIWLMIVQSPAWALVLAAASWLAVAVLAWQAWRWRRSSELSAILWVYFQIGPCDSVKPSVSQYSLPRRKSRSCNSRAWLTGTKPNLGENRKVTVNLR
jgi:MFS family permease